MVSSTVGSLTMTVWKRRARAASFSTYLRYSSSVVAPMACSSPRARAGFRILPASMEPSVAPAPTIRCSSSMNRMMRPSEFWTSLSTLFRRSSNSPRYLAPATSADMSSSTMSLSLMVDGTSPDTMRWARPSTMAVLPTPGSPMSTGLFLVRRLSTWMVRRTSSTRPMTGSSLPWRARSVTLRPYCSSASNCCLASWLVTRLSPRSFSYASLTRLPVTPALRSTLPASPLSSASAQSRCSEVT